MFELEGISERGSARISALAPWQTAGGVERRTNWFVLPRRRLAGDFSRRAGRTRVRNGNIFAILDKSENILDYINHNQTVILDPPRAGCDKKLIEKLLETRPQQIIYLSCNPATQARDIKLLLEKYQIKTIKTFNFFPHTPHIENLVLLS